MNFSLLKDKVKLEGVEGLKQKPVSRLKKNVGFLDPKVWIINLLQLFRFELASLTVHSNYFEGNGVCCETVFVYN